MLAHTLPSCSNINGNNIRECGDWLLVPVYLVTARRWLSIKPCCAATLVPFKIPMHMADIAVPITAASHIRQQKPCD